MNGISSISPLVQEFDDASKYIGVLLVGSEARGEANAFSDIDLVFLAKEEVTDERARYQLVYRDGRWISLSTTTLEAAQAAFTSPTEAINSIQGLRDCVVLRDSDDSQLSELRTRAQKFEWTASLKQAAIEQASYLMMGNAEEVHKVLAGLSNNNTDNLVNGAWGIALAMPMVMALKYKVLSAGESGFRKQVCEAVGLESKWTKIHSIAIGERLGESNRSPLVKQAIASVQLYEETAQLLGDDLLKDDKDVVMQAIQAAGDSKLIPAR